MVHWNRIGGGSARVSEVAGKEVVVLSVGEVAGVAVAGVGVAAAGDDGVAAVPVWPGTIGTVFTPCMVRASCFMPFGQGAFCSVSAPLASVQR